MRCCVQNCSNDAKTSAKSQGITFHLFPKEPVIRAAWLEALSLTNWEPKECSVVCSEHFKAEDVYEYKAGLRKVKRDAVPITISDCKEDLDSAATHRICRICLEIDTRFYDIREQNLGRMYEQVTGMYVNIDDPLPTRICWECAHRLQKAHSFKQKAIRAHSVLTEMIDTTCNLTIRDIKSINRFQTNLRSNLVKKKLYENEDCNLVILENEIIKSETNNDNKYNHNDNDNEYDENAYNGYDEEKEMKAVARQIIEATIKDESTNDINFNEYVDNLESDDDEKLSEIRPEAMEKKTEDGPMKENSEDNLSSLLDKYKINEIKSQKSDCIDENLFIITTLTNEEQIAEVEKRQESILYKNALFKCTICYRGFQIKEGYDRHVARHSEQYGAYECLVCKTRFKSTRWLRAHVAAFHSVKFSCKKCLFVTKYRTAAIGHEKWHSKYQCPHCPSTFEKRSTYLGHIRIKHVSDFVCELCGYMFISEKEIKEHKNLKHGMHDKPVELVGPYCDLCKVKFASEEAHSRHLKLSARHSSDNDPSRIRNEIIQKIRKRPSIQPRSKEKPIVRWPAPCEQCGVQLCDLRNYAQHFRHAHPDKNRTKHPPKKTPYMCEQCGKKFADMVFLKNHMWVHTGKKLFKCSHCLKSFTTKTSLAIHEAVHSATRPTYGCELCGKHFTVKTNLKRHMFVHTGLKPFKCEMCGKCFALAEQKKAHVAHVHLEKPYPRRARRRKAGGPQPDED